MRPSTGERPANIKEVVAGAQQIEDAITQFRKRFGFNYLAIRWRANHDPKGLMLELDVDYFQKDVLRPFIGYWQNINHVYTPEEQQLDTRIDCFTERREAA